MSWHYLPELVGGSSGPTSSGGEPSQPWKWNRIAGKSCCGVSGTVCYPCSRSGTTCGPSTDDPGVALWIASLRDSRASRSRSPANDAGQTTNGTCGPTPSEPYARYDRDSHSWRTYQGCLDLGTSGESLVTWTKVGTTRSGIAYQQPNAERITEENGSGYWPTPVAQDDNKTPEAHMAMKERMKGGPRKKPTSLNVMVKGIERGMWPTPRAHKHSGKDREDFSPSLHNVVGGQLNPPWVEWLMGWPIGWTDLQPLEMDKFRQWLSGHGRH